MPIFNKRGKLDTSQVEDRRGQRGARGMGGLPIPGGIAGGGTIGLILTVVMVVLALSGALGGGGSPGLGGGLSNLDGQTDSTLPEDCQTGADAEERDDCRMVAYINSIQRYWTDEYARQGKVYEEARTVFFTGQVSTGCGNASSAVGPFYCPADKQVYIDLGFFDQLREDFGATAGDFAPAYVLAHEYGHHVQNLEGTLASAQTGDREGEDSSAVRVELQADCYAGVWSSNASTSGVITMLTEEDIADALDAAASVGDDRIQERTQGQVNPESWTHGSSEQRQQWFTTGRERNNTAECDTFSGDV